MSGSNRDSQTETLSAETRRDQLTRNALQEVIRPLVIAGMLACIAFSFEQFVVSLDENWPLGYLSTLIFVIALESFHSFRLLKRLRLDAQDRWRFRFVEWVVILLIVRFAPYIFHGWDVLHADLNLWSRQIGAIFSEDFLLTSIFVLIFWVVALDLARTVSELEAMPFERAPTLTDPGHYLHSTMPQHGLTNRQAKIERLVTHFFWGGVFLLLFAGLSRVDLKELIVFRNSPSAGIVVNALVYFLLGFLLISHAQYTSQIARWELQDIPILGQLGQRWAIATLAFLVLIAFLSALLPVSYSISIIAVISTIIRWIVYIFAQIAFLIMLLFSFAIGLLMKLIGAEMPQALSSPAPMMTPPIASGTATRTAAPWWQLVRSLIFWTVLTGIVGYSLVQFVRARWGLLQGWSLRNLLMRLLNLLRGVHRGTRDILQMIREGLANRLVNSSEQSTKRAWRYIALRLLSPRDRIRYFYLSVVHRGARQGLPRQPSHTPLEHANVLRSALPDVESEIRHLTLAFVEARYSEHSISHDTARGVQGLWRRVKRALVLRRRLTKQRNKNES